MLSNLHYCPFCFCGLLTEKCKCQNLWFHTDSHVLLTLHGKCHKQYDGKSAWQTSPISTSIPRQTNHLRNSPNSWPFLALHQLSPLVCMVSLWTASISPVHATLKFSIDVLRFVLLVVHGMWSSQFKPPHYCSKVQLMFVINNHVNIGALHTPSNVIWLIALC